MSTPSYKNFCWIQQLPAGTILSLTTAEDEFENVGFACPQRVFVPTRLETRGTLRNWAIDNGIYCEECPVHRGYALLPADPNESFAIRMRWGGN